MEFQEFQRYNLLGDQNFGIPLKIKIKMAFTNASGQDITLFPKGPKMKNYYQNFQQRTKRSVANRYQIIGILKVSDFKDIIQINGIFKAFDFKIKK